jgi:uncharacterized protein YndB with AHSA1/START domain
MDFRISGREHISGGPPDAVPHAFDAVYYDIVPNERIIYGYDMHSGETRISVSLATVENEARGQRHTPQSSPSRRYSSTISTMAAAASRAPTACSTSSARRSPTRDEA